MILKGWHGLCNKEIETNTNAVMQKQSSQQLKDWIMKSKYFENGLALLGALVILVGVSAAASSALAGI